MYVCVYIYIYILGGDSHGFGGEGAAKKEKKHKKEIGANKT